MRIVCVSDTHMLHGSVVVPDGDVLVHAGDMTRKGKVADIEAVNAWLGTLPHRHKVVIAGNHDFGFEKTPAAAWAAITHAHYLQDSAVVLDGVRFYGSPWTPRFYDWAFNADRGDELARIWARVPPRVDVLVTHGPPKGILDRTFAGLSVGCEALRDALRSTLRPRLHVFGHIHESYGRVESDGTTYVNASTCNLLYRAVNPPVVVDLT